MANFNYLYSKTFISMSWLKNIYESIINEISAEDAYNRFYSSIPREDYDKILDGDPAPDKLMQFILNCVRDNNATTEEAVDAVKKYKSANELARQNVLNKFRAGEYEDLLDMTSDISYFSSGGAVLSRKKFAKEGYIKIKETEKWLMTCTTNYTASNHYFGMSHWCTASDREGNYDGYRMFLNYTDVDTKEINGDSSVLFQFKWKGAVNNDENDPEPLDEEYDFDNGRMDVSDFDEELGFIGKELCKRYSMFQAQVGVRDGNIGQICDFYDSPIRANKLKKYIGEELFNIMSDKEILSWAWNKMQEQYEKEKKYQMSQDVLIAKKKKRKEEAERRLREQLEAEVEHYNSEKVQRILSAWKEFFDNKMYLNRNIIKMMINRDVDGNNPETDSALADTNFAAITNIETNIDGIWFLTVSPIFGIRKYVTDEDRSPTISEYYSIDVPDNSDSIILLAFGDENNNIEKIGDVIAISDADTNINIREADNYGFSQNIRRFFLLERGSRGNGELKGVKLIDTAIMEGGKPKMIDLPENTFVWRCCPMNKEHEMFALFGRPGDYFAYYNVKNGIIVSGENYGRELYTLPYGRGIVLRGHGTNRIYLPYIGVYGQEVKENSAISNVDYYGQHISDGDLLLYELEYKDPGFNAVKVGGDGEPIFGVYGDSGHYINQDKVAIICDIKKYKNRSDSVRRILMYDRNNGYTICDDSGNPSKICDKYGRTEADQVPSKNYYTWLKNGGHSPEVQKQMDDMWDEYYGTGKGTKNAFDAWNDDDRKLDNDGLNMKYSPDFGFSKEMQSFDNDGRWRGYIAAKDPEGYTKDINRALSDPNFDFSDLSNGKIPDYVRRNPWYRIGKDGKPLDQPWYDEDEIPANLSDRVVRENKIKKEYNNMISIMERMGLIED